MNGTPWRGAPVVRGYHDRSGRWPVDLALNWYLVIPWVLGVGAWLIARQRNAGRSLLWGLVFFLIGSVIVLAIDLSQPS